MTVGEKTGIEWTDATWTPLRAVDIGGAKPGVAPVEVAKTLRAGWHCEHVSDGCANCYAETLNRRLGTGFDFKPGHFAPRGTVEVFLDEQLLLAPLRWKRPRRIFVCSMTDLFGAWVPDEAIDRVFAVMALCPQHIFQVLTKRPERMRAYLLARNGMGNAAICRSVNMVPNHLGNRHGALEMPLPNVWLGTSVEDQAAADARVPHLLATPAAKRFLSCEPLLGPVNLERVDVVEWDRATSTEPCGIEFVDALTGVFYDGEVNGLPGLLDSLDPKIDWVIAGGESGREARPMHPDWARSLRDQCAAAGVPFFFKQWGAYAPLLEASPAGKSRRAAWPDGTVGPGSAPANGGPGEVLYLATKKIAGRLLDGVTHDGMPA